MPASRASVSPLASVLPAPRGAAAPFGAALRGPGRSETPVGRDALFVEGALWAGPPPAHLRDALPLPARLPAPLSAYLALALAAEEDGSGRVILVGPSPAEDVPLGLCGEITLVAVWRATAAALGLPLAVIAETGAVESLERRLGAVALGLARPVRRASAAGAGARRPRFLRRRRAGRWAPAPAVHRGEAEIAPHASGR